MKTVLVCGGKIEDSFALSALEKIRPDCIIGIDRGLEFCYKYNIIPQYRKNPQIKKNGGRPGDGSGYPGRRRN